ncbi:MAG: hypothetical protein M3483_04765, partial [Gemmatimonadota bacterium]|nr:hypothetical protein [Gemmatimonadota bacterium]
MNREAHPERGLDKVAPESGVAEDAPFAERVGLDRRRVAIAGAVLLAVLAYGASAMTEDPRRGEAQARTRERSGMIGDLQEDAEVERTPSWAELAPRSSDPVAAGADPDAPEVGVGADAFVPLGGAEREENETPENASTSAADPATERARRREEMLEAALLSR